MVKIQSLMTVQIIKGINVDGWYRHVGDRIEVDSDRAKRMIQLGYARKVDPEAPYDYPVKDKSHGFHPVSFEDDKPKPKGKKPEPTTGEIPTFSEIGISGFAIGELKKEGIWTLGDIAGKTKVDLLSIPKISPKTADKLLEAYEMYVKGVNPEPNIEEK